MDASLELAVDLTPNGVPVIGPVLMLLLAAGIVVEAQLRGSGSRWEHVAPVGVLVILGGILARSVWVGVAGALVMAVGCGMSNIRRWARAERHRSLPPL
ncbi:MULTISPECIES: hypothetical protein [Kitasatospora]|uniref:hypothetical protein n=1 Tax=Kitasatospora TaxID=2063 RepID=UPI0003135579|nr:MULTISPECIES: hypothetical protein [Kitasatospora]